MQKIQWFPGHMTKAVRMMRENLKLIDGVIFVLDARCPLSCINKNLLKLFENKKVLYLLNKSDLVEKSALIGYESALKKYYGAVLSIVGTSARFRKPILSEVQNMLSEKLERNAARGIQKTLKIMVTGIPNTGKSTIINTLCGERRAAVGDKAGVTKGKQWISFSGFDLLDTPGTMPPNFDNQILARRLAYIGSINDDILDFPGLALSLIDELSEKYNKNIFERYGVDTTGREPLVIFEEICKKRGYILRGGELDYDRCAVSIIDDFRKGRLGKIALDEVSESF